MSTEKEVILDAVRNAISTDASFQNRWENILDELIATDAANDPQVIAQHIRRSGVLDEVIQKIRQEQSRSLLKSTALGSVATANIDSANSKVTMGCGELDLAGVDSLAVLFTLKKGSAFVDYVNAESLPLEDRPVIQLVFCHSGTRHTTSLYLAEPEIAFPTETQFAFSVSLAGLNSTRNAGRNVAEYLLKAKQKIFVYLLEYRQTNESWIPMLKMHGALEWRNCLHSSPVNQPLRVELKGIGEVAQQSLGVIEVEAQVGPPVPETAMVAADVVALHLTLESSKRTEAERAFINYARLWHKDFIEVAPVVLARRAVKLFVHDEQGCIRFPSSFVHPLSTARLIESPQQCARLVSLINPAPHELQSGTTNERDDIWFSIDATLVSSTTTSGGRAVLLCSFFLGLGLDAYVCLGRAVSTDHYEEEETVRVWVMTVVQGESSYERVVFWDPLQGASVVVRPKSAASLQQCPFRSVDCIFRHDTFLANIQADNKLIDVSFDLGDNDKWRALDVSACPRVQGNEPLCTLQPWVNRRFGSNSTAMADWLEGEFIRLFTEHRHNLNLSRPNFDQVLASALGMALTSYELASVFGSNFTIPKDFINSTRHIVPHGCVLRAVPLQLPIESVSSPVQSFTSALVRCQAARDVVELGGNHVHFGVRVKVTPYAERIASVWLMLASYTG